MDLLMHTADYPANERFDAWMDLVSRALVPVEVATADPVTYEGQMMATQFDRVGVASVTSSSCISHRTQRLINQADPNAVQLMLVTQGATGVTQNGTESTLRRGDVAIHTTWRPFTVHAVADGSGVVTGTTAVIPRDQIPLPTNAIEQLTAHAISGNEGSGALLAGLLVGLTKQPATPQSRGAWLACALTDVLTATLSAAVEHQAWLPRRPWTAHCSPGLESSSNNISAIQHSTRPWSPRRITYPRVLSTAYSKITATRSPDLFAEGASADANATSAIPT